MPSNAFDSGCRALSIRPHSEKELRDKLLKKGFEAQDISQAVTRLRELGYLNDEAAAIRWVQSALKEKRWGKYKITAYLIKKGISGEIVRRVVALALADTPEEETARQALIKKFGENYLSTPVQKAGFFLDTRGFSPEVIHHIISEFET